MTQTLYIVVSSDYTETKLATHLTLLVRCAMVHIEKLILLRHFQLILRYSFCPQLPVCIIDIINGILLLEHLCVGARMSLQP